MITSVRNGQVQSASKLLRRGVRDLRREFLVEGAKGVEQALAGPVRVIALFLEEPAGQFPVLARAARARKVPVLEVTGAVIRAISSTTSPQGVVAVCEFVDWPPADLLRRPLGLVVVLAGVRDPGNAGTIVRSCAAVGVDALFLGGGTVDVYNAKFVRATAGAIFNLPFARNVEIPWLLEELGDRALNMVAADPRGDVVYDQVDFCKPTAFVLGNESWGVPPDLAQACSNAVIIPMSGRVESLNVGMAATVLLFEAARQRRRGL
ncbi:MAG: TrmH family RNA methyltransferase [Actinomycetota bacterium]